MIPLGIDGCRSGWVAVWRDAPGTWQAAVFKSLTAVAGHFAHEVNALIDMPIGLPEFTPRDCDGLARRLLGSRACTVFSVPCRAAVYASDYAQACAVNAQFLGKRLSRQSFNLLPKIREADVLLQQATNLHLREAHPELCFFALNGSPLPLAKRTAAGRVARKALLRVHCPVDALLEETLARFPRALAADDLLDALVLAVAADSSHLISLPLLPPRDALGLEMAIHYGPVSPAPPP